MTEKEREDVKRLVKRSGKARFMMGFGFSWVLFNSLIKESNIEELGGMPLSTVCAIIGIVLMLFAGLQEDRILKELPKLVG